MISVMKRPVFKGSRIAATLKRNIPIRLVLDPDDTPEAILADQVQEILEGGDPVLVARYRRMVEKVANSEALAEQMMTDIYRLEIETEKSVDKMMAELKELRAKRRTLARQRLPESIQRAQVGAEIACRMAAKAAYIAERRELVQLARAKRRGVMRRRYEQVAYADELLGKIQESSRGR